MSTPLTLDLALALQCTWLMLLPAVAAAEGIAVKRKSDTQVANVFTQDAIASDLDWVPDMAAVGEAPITADAYVLAYLADPRKWSWSTSLLHDRRETVLKRALAVIGKARLPDHEKALGQLGAGCLEDMMSDGLLDDLQSWLPFEPAMRYALSQVRMSVESEALQQRLKIMFRR